MVETAPPLSRRHTKCLERLMVGAGWPIGAEDRKRIRA